MCQVSGSGHLLILKDEGTTSLWNVRNNSSNDTVSHTRRPQSSDDQQLVLICRHFLKSSVLFCHRFQRSCIWPLFFPFITTFWSTVTIIERRLFYAYVSIPIALVVFLLIWIIFKLRKIFSYRKCVMPIIQRFVKVQAPLKALDETDISCP